MLQGKIKSPKRTPGGRFMKQKAVDKEEDLSFEMRIKQRIANAIIFPGSTTVSLTGITTNSIMKELSQFTEIQDLTITDASDITKSGYKQFAKLINLHTLNISKITTDNFDFLIPLTQLTTLVIKNSDLKGVKVFPIMPNLISLDLTGSTLRAMTTIKPDFFPNLMSMNLSRVQSQQYPVSKLTLSSTLTILSMESNYLPNSITEISTLINLKELNISNNKIKDEDMKIVSHLPRIIKLNISRCKLTDVSYDYLSNMVSLTSLDISFCKVKDKDLYFIEKLVNLTELHLTANKISTIIPLTNLVKLEILQLGNCPKLVSSSLRKIGKLINLTQLDVNDCFIGPNALKYIGKLKHLTNLNVSDNQFSIASGIEYLVNSKLTGLSMANAMLTNKHLKQIAQIKNLLFLDIGGLATQYSNRGLRYLTGLSKLSTLIVSENQYITSKGIGYLSELPNLKQLNMFSTILSKDVLPILNTFPALKKINLSDCPILIEDIDIYAQNNPNREIFRDNRYYKSLFSLVSKRVQQNIEKESNVKEKEVIERAISMYIRNMQETPGERKKEVEEKDEPDVSEQENRDKFYVSERKKFQEELVQRSNEIIELIDADLQELREKKGKNGIRAFWKKKL